LLLLNGKAGVKINELIDCDSVVANRHWLTALGSALFYRQRHERLAVLYFTVNNMLYNRFAFLSVRFFTLITATARFYTRAV